MPEYLGPIAIPEAAPAGVFPLVPEFGMVFASEPEIAVHRFGHGETQVEQRFWLGPGARRITLRFEALNAARRQALVNFFQLRQGSYQPFSLDVAMPDGATVRHTVRFAEPALSLDQFSESLWRGAVELVEAPQDTPSLTVTQTLTRFPSAELATTLLGQTQELIPLVTIGSDIHLSDRRVSVGGVLYQPRLVDWDGISQALDGSADSARFRLGNADRVLTELVNDVDLWKQPVTFSLFHVGSATRIDLWKGFVTRWSLDQAGAFELEASDGLFELNLPYPSRKITRDEVKIPDQPVNVGGKKGISRMTATSVVNDTAYGRALKDIYVNDATHPIPVECEIVAGRDESEFYAALGIVGRGPISGFATSTAQPHTLDGQPNHGPGSLGLRRSYGGNPVTGDETPADNSPDSGSHTFALDSVGEPLPNNPVPGVAFLQIRRTDEKGIQPIRPTERKMQAQITGGLGCWAWAAPGARLWLPACTNPVWIAVNTLLRAKGLSSASAAAQEALFDVPAAVSAAQTCEMLADRIIGAGQEPQFRFTGVLAEERPLRDWLQEILGSCLGYFTFVAGKLRIGLRIHSSVVEAFTTGNILYNSLSLGSLEPRFNDLTAAFADVDYGYQQNALNLYDADHAVRIGERLKANVNLVGVATKSQAARLITTRLREELGGLTAAEQLAARQISFRTTVLALNTEPGMVCSMTHPDMPNGAGEFRVIRWRLNRDYSIDIEGRSTTDSTYDLTVGDKPTDVVPEPVPQLPAADLFPGKVTGIEMVGTVQFDGLTAEVTLRYLPPEPLGVFRGVGAFARMPEDSGEVPLEKGSARFEPDAEGRGTIRLSLTQPAGSDRECRIWLCSRSAILTASLDEENTPSIVVTIPAATPVGDVPLANITSLTAGHQIADGRVLITITGAAPVDENFAGAEVFLEIPQEADTDPEHLTLPGQFYRQNWHFGEPSIEGTPRQWEAKLDVPVPPTEYLQSLVSPKITWLAYALPRSWGYTNRLKRLTSLDPVAPSEHTPFVQVTLDFADYLAGVVSDELGSVTLVGDPVIADAGGEIRVAQDYIPPYFGIEGAFTIGAFEGVAAVLEMADGTVYDRGIHPYTANPDAPGENVDSVRISVPKPAAYPVTAYLHMMSYSPTARQKFKKVINSGVPTVHAQYAIRQFTITEEGARPATPADFTVVFDGYHADSTGLKKGRIDASWTQIPGEEYIYGLWIYEGSAPPVSAAQWKPTTVNTLEAQATFWVDVPTTATRLYFALVWQTAERALTPADYGSALPVAYVDLPSPHVAVSAAPPARTWEADGDLRLQALRSADSGFLPPTTGTSNPPTLDPLFSGVQVFWERPGEPTRPYLAGRIEYDGDVGGVFPATLGEIDVTIPRGEIPAAGTYYLRLVPYGPGGASLFVPANRAPAGSFWTFAISAGELIGTPSTGVAPNPPANVTQRVTLTSPTTFDLTVIWDPPSPVGSTIGYQYERAYGVSVTPPGAGGAWEPAGTVFGELVREAGAPNIARPSIDKHVWTRACAINSRGERSAWVYSTISTAVARVAPPTPTQTLSAAVVVSSPPGHAEAYTLVVTPTMPVPATGAVEWQIRRGAFSGSGATGQIGSWIEIADRIPIDQNSWTFGAWERPAPGAEFYAGIEIRLIHTDGSMTAWVPCSTPLPQVSAAAAPLNNFSNLSTIHHGVIDGVPSYWFTKKVSFPAQTDWATIYWLKVEARAYTDAGMTTPDSDWMDIGGLDPRGAWSGSAFVSEQETAAWKLEDYATWWKVRITPLNVDNAPGTPVEVSGLALPASTGIEATALDQSTLDASLGVVGSQLSGLRRGLVINPDWTAGSRGWNFDGEGSSIITGANAYSGNSLQMTAGANTRYVTQMISGFAPGQVVRLEVFAWSNLTGGTGQAIIQFLDAAFGWLHNEYVNVTGNSAWTLYRAVKAAPANTAHVQIIFAVPAGASGYLRIDNVSLTTEEPTTGAITRTAAGVAVNYNNAEFGLVGGELTVNGVPLTKAVGFDPMEFSIAGGDFELREFSAAKATFGQLGAGVTYTGVIYVSQLVGGAASFTDDVTFARSGGGSVVINSGGVTISYGGTSLSIGSGGILGGIAQFTSIAATGALTVFTSGASQFAAGNGNVNTYVPLTVQNNFSHTGSGVSLSNSANWRTALGLATTTIYYKDQNGSNASMVVYVPA